MKYIYLSLIALAILVASNQKTVLKAETNLSDSTAFCIVSGEKIEGEGVKYQYLNSELTFCCEGCEKSFKKNPDKYLSAAGLTCPVCDEDDAKKELSLMNDGVKYYFCGKGCLSNFESDPETHLKKYKK